MMMEEKGVGHDDNKREVRDDQDEKRRGEKLIWFIFIFFVIQVIF